MDNGFEKKNIKKLEMKSVKFCMSGILDGYKNVGIIFYYK